ncbi:MAG: hypothetical protein ACP5N7_07260, partial [Candidatus Pacearchaeota archaeon]
GGFVGKAAKLPTLLSTMLLSTSQAAEEYNTALQITGDEDKAYKTFIGNLPFAATEVLPFERLFSRLDKLGGRSGKQLIVDMFTQGTIEGAQEVIQQFGANLNTKMIYDSSKSLSEGTLDGGLAGFVTGMLMTGIGNAATNKLNDGNLSEKEITELTEAIKNVNLAKSKVENIFKQEFENLPIEGVTQEKLPTELAKEKLTVDPTQVNQETGFTDFKFEGQQTPTEEVKTNGQEKRRETLLKENTTEGNKAGVSQSPADVKPTKEVTNKVSKEDVGSVENQFPQVEKKVEKQPYEMRVAEVLESATSSYDGKEVAFKDIKDKAERDKIERIYKKRHKDLVQQAINEGKIESHPDYPELSKTGTSKLEATSNFQNEPDNNKTSALRMFGEGKKDTDIVTALGLKGKAGMDQVRGWRKEYKESKVGDISDKNYWLKENPQYAYDKLSSVSYVYDKDTPKIFYDKGGRLVGTSKTRPYQIEGYQNSFPNLQQAIAEVIKIKEGKQNQATPIKEQTENKGKGEVKPGKLTKEELDRLDKYYRKGLSGVTPDEKADWIALQEKDRKQFVADLKQGIAQAGPKLNEKTKLQIELDELSRELKRLEERRTPKNLSARLDLLNQKSEVGRKVSNTREKILNLNKEIRELTRVDKVPEELTEQELKILKEARPEVFFEPVMPRSKRDFVFRTNLGTNQRLSELKYFFNNITNDYSINSVADWEGAGLLTKELLGASKPSSLSKEDFAKLKERAESQYDIKINEIPNPFGKKNPIVESQSGEPITKEDIKPNEPAEKIEKASEYIEDKIEEKVVEPIKEIDSQVKVQLTAIPLTEAQKKHNAQLQRQNKLAHEEGRKKFDKAKIELINS